MIKARARVVDQPPAKGGAQALLETLIGPTRGEAELHAHAKRLQLPVTRADKVLGKLTLDRRINSYDGRAKWNGKAVTVSVSADEGGDPDAGIQVAHALWRAQARWSRRVSDFAVAKLLKLKNENWLDENEKPVTAKEFRRRMKLETVSVYGDGSFAFWHDDGELFWGHAIQVSGDLKSGPRDADIPG